MPFSAFHPIVRDWFVGRFREPTEPQRFAWPHLVDGRHVLIAAPTGSGKTMAAFLPGIDRLLRRSLSGELTDSVDIVYISPLKALSSDVRRNLIGPLEEIQQQAQAVGHDTQSIRVAVRTGDTPASERQAMVRRPPQILVTTPESLYLLLTSPKSREMLRSARTVIVDEIHALARDKRGSHLTLSLERLDALCESPPTRIGLSATQRPMDEIARFLVGAGNVLDDGRPQCEIIDVGHLRQLDLNIEVPPSELAAVCSHEQWGEVYARLVELIQSHRSTLVFVNTRRLAERVTHSLAELLGEEAVASHHGSLARQLRHSAEQRLKEGQLKAVVATASLEMGIDVGYIDLVCQIGSPRSIATFLQRVGRSGHSLGVIPKGRLFPLTRDELVEGLALIRAARQGRLDTIEIPRQPFDILAQQIVAATAADDWDEDALFDLCRRAWPYRNLQRSEFDELLHLLHEGMSRQKHGAYLLRDRVNRKVRARRHARIAAVTSGGAIPEVADYRVVTEEDRTYVGSVNEDFAIESLAGDVFLLGNMSWRIRYVRGGEVVVSDAHGAPASVPFWLGEAPGRTDELSTEVSLLRQEIADRIDVTKFAGVESYADSTSAASWRRESGGGDAEIGGHRNDGPGGFNDDYIVRARPPADDSATAVADLAALGTPHSALHPALTWLAAECPVESWAMEQTVRYVAAQKAAVGFVPTRWKILFERFFDESGGMQVVIHAPLGGRVTRAWGLAIRKRFCRSFDFELQASADDDGFVLAVGPQHSFPIDGLFKMLNRSNGETLLTQALLAAPMFENRWRWNATRSLAVLRMKNGKKVPPHLQRFKSDDFLAAVFPAKTGCFENHHGDIDVPDHPLVRQTIHDCHTEAMDLTRWLAMLDDFAAGRIEFVALDTREPSPFSHELINAQPYAFLDDAPAEERRARAVATRRGLQIDAVRDLGRLEPEAIEQVRGDAWPTVRDADELHDVLLSMVAVSADAAAPWRGWFELLRQSRRATVVHTRDGRTLWVAAERIPTARALFAIDRFEPEIHLPADLDQPVESTEAAAALLRGWMPCVGPTTPGKLSELTGLAASQIAATLEALEGDGTVLRGTFTAVGNAAAVAGAKNPEWCDRRLLARIHRLTLDGLRRQIQPVEPDEYFRFLLGHQRLTSEVRLRGRAGLRELIGRLQGLEVPAGAWEPRVLTARLADYDPLWLDELSLSGEVVWGRLQPPRRDEADGPSSVGLSRVMPIALASRQDLPWLLPGDRNAEEVPLRGNALDVLDALKSRGALFYNDLLALTSLLPGHVDAALYELAAQGLVSSDAFGAVRALVNTGDRQTSRVRLRARRRRVGACTMAGRWSLFPGVVVPPTHDDRVQRWCWLLLSRWGVVFRDLLERETCAPPWWRLVAAYRRMEARGEIRGGRFVRGVAGEQFALGSSIEALRQSRDASIHPKAKDTAAEAVPQWLILSAADPLNLTGIVLPGPRLPAVTGNLLIIRDGRIVATRQAGELRMIEQLDDHRTDELLRQLRRTG